MSFPFSNTFSVVRPTQRAADWQVRKAQMDKFSTRQPLTRAVGRREMAWLDLRSDSR